MDVTLTPAPTLQTLDAVKVRKDTTMYEEVNERNRLSLATKDLGIVPAGVGQVS